MTVRLALALFSLVVAARADYIPLGIVVRNIEVPVDIPFTYQGEGETTITKVETSCDCLNVVASPQKAPKGVAVSIPCSYRSSAVGKALITVQVWSGDRLLQRYSAQGFVCDRESLCPVSAALQKKETLFVDVRSRDQFAEAHIPRSVNLPLFSLKARADLKEQEIVLVDNGYAPFDLLQSVVALHDLGFHHVTALNGGLPGWLREGGAWEGSAADPVLASAVITAAEYARSSIAMNWSQLALDDGGEKDHSKKIRELSAAAVPMGRACGNLLIITAEGANYGSIEHQVHASGVNNVYYLAGGRVALDHFRAQQRSLAEKSDQTFQVRAPRPNRLAAGGGLGCATCAGK